MSVSAKRSTITAREQPVPHQIAVTGTLEVRGEILTLETSERVEVFDLTERVMALVRTLPVREGLVNLCSMHTTCTVCINEFQPALLADIKTFLARVVDGDADWRHNDPAHSDCDRANADAHLRAMLLGHSLTLQVSGGEVVLGQWQRVLVAELDGPRTRSLRLLVMGAA